MDRAKWEAIEGVLDRHGIAPIVAVIPDNRDSSLMIDARDEKFWDRVRAWEAKGWTIAMHGLTHVMHPTDSKLVLPYYKRSEFAGLSLAEQASKIKASRRLFNDQGIEPRVWIAPAHCFDLLTLQAIQDETPIRVVSDGIALNTYYEHAFYWIPQQIPRLTRRWFGLWTVCLHPNSMTEESIAAFDRDLGGYYRGKMIGFRDLRMRPRAKSAASRIFASYFWWRWGLASR
jgi:predicted deacetylase